MSSPTPLNKLTTFNFPKIKVYLPLVFDIYFLSEQLEIVSDSDFLLNIYRKLSDLFDAFWVPHPPVDYFVFRVELWQIQVVVLVKKVALPQE